MKQTLKDLTRKSVFLSMMLLACSGIFAKSKTMGSESRTSDVGKDVSV